MNEGKPHICLVAHYAYGALIGGSNGHIGGVERQTSLLAKWLAAKGYPVSMVTYDEGQTDGMEIDGVRVYKLCRKDAGVKGVRFVYPRWASLNAALNRANAQLYYQNCAGVETGQVGLWCKRHGRQFVYSVASNPDCDRNLPEMKTLQERVLYRYGLRNANQVIVQTKTQQDMLQKDFGRNSEVLPMPGPDFRSEGDVDRELAADHSRRVLWIGRICEEKRPDRLLDIAEACAEIAFDVVGPMYDSEYVRGVCERAKTLPNVTLHGKISRDKVAKYYENAHLLCCTSDFEGFPNTFLEAWSLGLPVVSTVDPDGVIVANGLGWVAQGVEEIIIHLKDISQSPENWTKASRAARQYYLAHHTPEKCLAAFERLLLRVATNNNKNPV